MHPIRVFKGDRLGFMMARVEQDKDNRCTVEECAANDLEVGGSYEDGYFYIDDGGSIDLVEVEE